jgi:primosomal protein N' (replication factor Y)
MRDLFQEQESVDPVVKPALGQVKQVLVPYPVDKAYDYAVPAEMDVRDGDYVCVPLGGREVPAVVWSASASLQRDKGDFKLKYILEHYNLPPMPEAHREFIAWVAKYTLSPLGSVLKMAVSVASAMQPPAPAIGYQICIESIPKLPEKQQIVMDIMADGQVRRPAEIADLAGVSAGVVKTLTGKGLLKPVELTNPAPCRHPDPMRDGPELSDIQAAAADHLRGAVRDKSGGVHLLDGVTGAGKTEVYFEAVAEALKAGKQALILLPEIALSNAFLERFRKRFGCDPALWHSNLTPAQRRIAWRGVAEGQSKVVIGARSALFLPFAELGLIIVDEEHDPAYKQEEGVRYHARDMAVVRGHLGALPVVLVSATPSLETMQNVWDGKYHHLTLPARFGGASLPQIDLVDLRVDKPDRGDFIAPSLRAGMIETLTRGEQVLLFLNRRGYAPLTLCRTCGHRMECPRCSAWLVEHKNAGLSCHHCGFHASMPKTCPSCSDVSSLVACGPGVERIAEEVERYFPDARVMVLASDTADNQDELRVMLEKIRRGEVDIIIGTQIVAKGHHFPQLTLVGVIDADLGLQGGELRASERVYQLLHQVAGRAGRAEKAGSVFLQSFMPDHRIMRALAEGDRDGFLAVEAEERRMAEMPPFARLAGIIVTARDERQALEVAKALGRCAPQGDVIHTLGPAPAPLSKLRGRYRFRLLVRAEKQVNIQKAVADWIVSIKVPSTVRVIVDIDPQSFM